ncbi:rhodanese-like domain-containing protein [Solimonas marina]|uniref:Rhodanese-like domain-containing protein n=1 Tax=Solimonas marina TaxID=2714601 RepID=A0A969W985_9GAMM|nr:rhodanese-like domain-containing protein [Solimonas marina]NKF20700.1 rhodanese-like domain-containing protein [Solimonas marina]
MAQFFEFFQAHLVLFIALLVVLALLVANELHGNMTGGKKMSTADAVRLINDRDPLIVDIRPAADFKRGHLLGAFHAPAAKIDDYLGQLARDKARPVLVYCALGGSSGTVAEKLRKNGMAEVYPLRGGINAWTTANLPVTTK